MLFDIEWDKETADELNESVRKELIETINSGHIDIDSCHAGALRVQAKMTGPLANQLVGNIKCSCGTALAKIKGNENGSRITITMV